MEDLILGGYRLPVEDLVGIRSVSPGETEITMRGGSLRVILMNWEEVRRRIRAHKSGIIPGIPCGGKSNGCAEAAFRQG